jgi:hypothetical protein
MKAAAQVTHAVRPVAPHWDDDGQCVRFVLRRGLRCAIRREALELIAQRPLPTRAACIAAFRERRCWIIALAAAVAAVRAIAPGRALLLTSTDVRLQRAGDAIALPEVLMF